MRKWLSLVKRRWYLIPVVLLALLLIAGLALFLALGSIVRTGVSTVLPKVTGTPANMGGFSLNPMSGTLRISDFHIGNPEGYQEKHVFALKELKVGLAPGSLLSDRIVVREVLIDGLQVSYETKLTESNVGRIKEKVDQFTRKDRPSARPQEEQAGDQGKPGKKIQIDDLRFRNGAVTMRAGVAGAGARTTVPLPEIHLTGIGQEQEGASIEEVAAQIYAALNEAIMKAVASAGSVSADDLQDTGKKAADGLVKGLKDLL